MTIGQIFGYLAALMMFLSYQTKTPKKLIMVQSISVVCIITHYLLIGATSGFMLNIVCLCRNFVYFFDDKVKFFKHPLCAYLMAAVMGAVGALSWQGPVSLLIIVALMVNTVFMSFNNNQLLRASVIVTSSMILLYNFFMTSYGGMINESIGIISSIIGLYRYRGQKEE
ncbi:MAG: YgjV family protein [Ruminococcaceae bacterium]|nr:YgjV family protein [Oscillospiraceae bacterium]